MTESEPRQQFWLLAVVAFMAGPGAAVLYETDILRLGPSATLWPIGFVAVVAAAGLVTGFGIGARASKALGALVVFPNGLVLAFYGFLLLFFGLGGSR